ncbi:MAG TPA: hypothetical protein VEZ72_22510, partial [Paenibacillus sp.]|nr:hypothetical protein [Paenibacillus sp.]
GVELRVRSEELPDIQLQAVCLFDASGSLDGEALERKGAAARLLRGAAEYRLGADRIVVEGGAFEHEEWSLRNDPAHSDALTLAVNWTTPADRALRIRCFSAEEDEAGCGR